MTTSRWPLRVFVLGVLTVLAALAWVTYHAVRLERAEFVAREEARYQESIRLALWRMDAAITPIIAREAARPYFHYQPVFPADRAYSNMLGMARPGDELVSSPLLQAAEEPIKLYFQRIGEGPVTSPQVPVEDQRAAAEAVATGYGLERAETDLATLDGLIAVNVSAARKNERLAGAFDPDGRDGKQDEGPFQDREQQGQRFRQQQELQNANEYSSRQTAVSNAAREKLGKNAPAASVSDKAIDTAPEQTKVGERQDGVTKEREIAPATPAKDELAAARPPAPAIMADSASRALTARLPSSDDGVETGPFVARWLTRPGAADAELVFERQVAASGTTMAQGFWIDWPALRSRLLESARDLLPAAELRPFVGGVEGVAPAVLGRTLASIPAELVAPMPALAPGPLMTPVRSTLAVTWVIALIAVAAIALVLRSSMELAERRGQFVTAVTHELRTPLTTFVMYSQMLADGMVPTDDARRSYLATLKAESQRLARIVESVLEYARLGKRGKGTVRTRATAGDLLDALTPVLQRRCEQGGMTLDVAREGPMDIPVTTESATLERILFNLVDNACKYAAAADDKRVHLIARADGKDLVLSVRDHGPGINPREHAAVFRPFTRGERQHDGAVPGLGLGLALAHGLARELGGELRLVPATSGAEFCVRVPRI